MARARKSPAAPSPAFAPASDPCAVPFEHRLLRVHPDVSGALGESRSSTYQAISEGRLRAVMHRGVLRVRGRDLLAYLLENTSEATPDVVRRVGRSEEAAP